ncbi:MAG: HlyD family secretion protein, partial [Planctomycetes bacterium]|nr:HlyD family secretion protein [Planctomycetota bacterium]
MTTTHDLRQLAIDRRPAAENRPEGRRRHVISRYVLPAGVLLGFASLLAWAMRDRFLPATPVTVVPVVVTRAEVQKSGTPLFQAPGWVEPRPTAVLAAALTEGVIEELLVVEGQAVETGEPVARLIDADARIALEQAEAELQLREADVESAQAELTAARLRSEQPVHLEAALAEAESQLAQAETELSQLPYQIQAAEARLDFAHQSLASKQASRGAVAGVNIQQAQSEHDQAASRLEELRGYGPRLERQIAALRRKRAALATQRELLVEESRQLAEAEAAVQAAEARKRLAAAQVEAAKLRLERMVVRAPTPGRVLELLSSPGTRVAGRNSDGQHGAGAVASLYDPQMLQVRVDVRLEDVPLVASGQPVTIETASSAEALYGAVLLPTSKANIQKNTLEVKVAIHDPPPTVRPEML